MQRVGAAEGERGDGERRDRVQAAGGQASRAAAPDDRGAAHRDADGEADPELAHEAATAMSAMP